MVKKKININEYTLEEIRRCLNRPTTKEFRESGDHKSSEVMSVFYEADNEFYIKNAQLVKFIVKKFGLEKIIGEVEKLTGTRVTATLDFYDEELNIQQPYDCIVVGNLEARGFSIKILPKDKIPSHLELLYSYLLKLEGHYSPEKVKEKLQKKDDFDKAVEINHNYKGYWRSFWEPCKSDIFKYKAEDNLSPSYFKERVSKVEEEMNNHLSSNKKLFIDFYSTLLNKLLEDKEEGSAEMVIEKWKHTPLMDEHSYCVDHTPKIVIYTKKNNYTHLERGRNLLILGFKGVYKEPRNKKHLEYTMGIVQYDFLSTITSKK